jgi:tRNA splicing endonuclease
MKFILGASSSLHRDRDRGVDIKAVLGWDIFANFDLEIVADFVRLVNAVRDTAVVAPVEAAESGTVVTVNIENTRTPAI